MRNLKAGTGTRQAEDGACLAKSTYYLFSFCCDPVYSNWLAIILMATVEPDANPLLGDLFYSGVIPIDY
jgi:hypothetical protein